MWDHRRELRQIAGFSRILAEDCAADLNADAKKHLHRMVQGAQLMGNLVDDLLLLARVSRQKLSRRAVSLNEILAGARETLRADWEGRPIEWRIDDLWTAHCDPGLVAQVFVNLLSNALKFTRWRDPATIHVGQSRVDGEKVVFVRDNGAGFNMAHANKLFGVFQRFHPAQDFEGTGVGLANVQRIVHKHGGRIWAEAEVEKGACFYLTLPDAFNAP